MGVLAMLAREASSPDLAIEREQPRCGDIAGSARRRPTESLRGWFRHG